MVGLKNVSSNELASASLSSQLLKEEHENCNSLTGGNHSKNQKRQSTPSNTDKRSLFDFSSTTGSIGNKKSKVLDQNHIYKTHELSRCIEESREILESEFIVTESELNDADCE